VGFVDFTNYLIREKGRENQKTLPNQSDLQNIQLFNNNNSNNYNKVDQDDVLEIANLLKDQTEP
jgi:hypothetical protein